MKKYHFILCSLFVSVMVACSDSDKDDEVPVIDMTVEDAFPQNCVTVFKGETFVFKARLVDNAELGSYSIEMHNNFDHHTHSTSIVECELDPIKTPVNPLYFVNEYTIPAGQTDYIATQNITIPTDVDAGDYHFMLRVTHKEGWQTSEGISLKVVERE